MQVMLNLAPPNMCRFVETIIQSDISMGRSGTMKYPQKKDKLLIDKFSIWLTHLYMYVKNGIQIFPMQKKAIPEESVFLQVLMYKLKFTH